MVRINKIYTKTGDDGSTALIGGERVFKASPRVEAYGEVDELNSFVGWCVTISQNVGRDPVTAKLKKIQNKLFDIGSELATPAGSEWPGMAKTNAADSTTVEGWIDELMDGIPPLTSFVLPGGTELNSALHIARAVCRRVERNLIRIAANETISKEVLIYFNRLSDLLFAMARFESHSAKIPENLWEVGK